MTFCSLCGSTNPADLGQVIGICLDATACHQRQYARLRDRADEATARADTAEARLTRIADRCRERLNAPGRSGMSRTAAGIILGIAEGGSEGKADEH